MNSINAIVNNLDSVLVVDDEVILTEPAWLRDNAADVTKVTALVNHNPEVVAAVVAVFETKRHQLFVLPFAGLDMATSYLRENWPQAIWED